MLSQSTKETTLVCGALFIVFVLGTILGMAIGYHLGATDHAHGRCIVVRRPNGNETVFKTVPGYEIVNKADKKVEVP